jgi:hypothetical protein
MELLPQRDEERGGEKWSFSVPGFVAFLGVVVIVWSIVALYKNLGEPMWPAVGWWAAYGSIAGASLIASSIAWINGRRRFAISLFIAAVVVTLIAIPDL